jgi:hypothetical protein
VIRYAVGHKLFEIRQVHGGPRLAGIDVREARWRLLTHTQHAQEYRSDLPGFRVPGLRIGFPMRDEKFASEKSKG